MVVRIVTHFFQVVVFAAHAQAFLRVRHSFILGGVIAQNNIFPLVHAGVRKH